MPTPESPGLETKYWTGLIWVPKNGEDPSFDLEEIPDWMRRPVLARILASLGEETEIVFAPSEDDEEEDGGS